MRGGIYELMSWLGQGMFMGLEGKGGICPFIHSFDGLGDKQR